MKTRLAELAAKFLERTHGDIAAMRADFERLAAGDGAAMSGIRHLSHRMVGTGATLGFTALSDCARHIEKLSESVALDAMPDENTRAQLAGALDALAAELQRLRSQP